tara:strand:- start:464 stop:637 length:174 start_codon:yes stop_codon:yes gene_type:complete
MPIRDSLIFLHIRLPAEQRPTRNAPDGFVWIGSAGLIPQLKPSYNRQCGTEAEKERA